MTFRRLRNYAGLAAAIIPLAMATHLVAELTAVGRDAGSPEFVVRHAYFGVFFAAAAGWFGATLGLGKPLAERRRRCALLRAELGPARRPQSVLTLIGANLAFFAATQAVEGIPIASGAVWTGLVVALAGSLLCALLVFVCGDSLVSATLDVVIGTSLRQRCPAQMRQYDRAIALARHATCDYSLFVPNRPPPAVSQF